MTLELELAAAAVVAPTEAATGTVVTAPEAAAASGDDDEGTLELPDELVEKTKMMTMTDEVDVHVGAAASAENKDDDAGRRRHQIYHEESAANSSKVPVPASLVVAQTTRKKKKQQQLLVLDLNGLTADINQDFHNAHLSHGRCRGKLGFNEEDLEDEEGCNQDKENNEEGKQGDDDGCNEADLEDEEGYDGDDQEDDEEEGYNYTSGTGMDGSVELVSNANEALLDGWEDDALAELIKKTWQIGSKISTCCDP